MRPQRHRDMMPRRLARDHVVAPLGAVAFGIKDTLGHRKVENHGERAAKPGGEAAESPISRGTRGTPGFLGLVVGCWGAASPSRETIPAGDEPRRYA